MNFSELIYKLVEFFYTDIWRFIQLIITILLLRGMFNKLINSTRLFFSSVIVRFKQKTREDDFAEKLQHYLPKELKKYMANKQEKDDAAKFDTGYKEL